MGMGRQDLLHARAAMPRGLIDRDDDLGIHACRIHTRHLLEMHGKGRLVVAAVYCVLSALLWEGWSSKRVVNRPVTRLWAAKQYT